MFAQLAFAVFALGSAVFFYYNYPEIDLEFSRLFYRPGEGFIWGDTLLVQLLYKSAPIIVFLFVISTVYYGIRTLWRVRSFHPQHYIQHIYLTLVCLLGPGFMVHTVLKNHIGRARPIEILEFGGSSYFTPAFMVSNQCWQNCSFVSGHAAVGYMIFGIAYLYQGKARLYWQILATFLGSFIGLARVAQGGHFLSDVVFSGVFVFLTAYLLSQLLHPHQQLINGKQLL